MSASSIAAPAAPSVATLLLPIMAAVSIGFLVIGLALPVLPLHVHQDLDFGNRVVGLVTGIQFVASLVSRVCAGHFSDHRGAKNAVIVGGQLTPRGNRPARSRSLVIEGRSGKRNFGAPLARPAYLRALPELNGASAGAAHDGG